jgi:cytochrome c553
MTKLGTLIIALGFVLPLYAQTFETIVNQCAGCHGLKGEKKALGVSKVINTLAYSTIVDALKAYRDTPTYGGKLKKVMQNQVKMLSDHEIKALAQRFTPKTVITVEDHVKRAINEKYAGDPEVINVLVEAFETSQTSWKTYAKQTCGFMADLFAYDGQAVRLHYQGCMDEQKKAREESLRQMLRDPNVDYTF